MGIYHTLVNLTKKERISFAKLPVSKEREIAGNPAAAAIVAWYLLRNSGDSIGFFGDESESPFPGINYRDICKYPDHNERVLSDLIREGILVDCGILWRDEEDASVCTRDIRNAWMPPEWFVSAE